MTTTKPSKSPKPITHDASAFRGYEAADKTNRLRMQADETHGASDYRNRGCRCPVCTRAHADYMRPRMAAYRARRRAAKN
jgi:hypothetical protein